MNAFDFVLPPSLVAQFPSENRGDSRLLVVRNHQFEHRRFHEIVDLIPPRSLLVLNETKVIPARLFGEIETGQIEILLLSKKTEKRWECLVRPGKKIRKETPVSFQNEMTAILFPLRPFEIEFSHWDRDWFAANGHMPIPPYLKRRAVDLDRQRYQTVYAEKDGSIAAPTAGLHFSPEILSKLREREVEVAFLTLHIGYGTFAPVSNIENHSMHFENYSIPPHLLSKIEAVRARGNKVIAVGTTTVRALESAERFGRVGQTNLFIKPGYVFKTIDGLITNFHLPKSSLFILVSAFLGLDQTHAAYRTAIQNDYRFFSYGDAMVTL